jgi:DNA-binding response OmpR family regulator
MRALIIEDDESVVESLGLVLRMRWPDMEIISSRLGEEGLSLIESSRPNIVILDLGLPDISGFEVLKQIRLFTEVPVVILTVLGEEDDIVRGLELGANDYILKPFRKMEFLARINSLLRKQMTFKNMSIYEKGPFHVDISNHKLFFNNKEVFLTKSECLIFHMLITNTNILVSYHSLAITLWGEEYPGSVEAIRVYMQRLRKKIEQLQVSSGIIETKIGSGYIFNYLSEDTH